MLFKFRILFNLNLGLMKNEKEQPRNHDHGKAIRFIERDRAPTAFTSQTLNETILLTLYLVRHCERLQSSPVVDDYDLVAVALAVAVLVDSVLVVDVPHGFRATTRTIREETK